MDEPERTPLTAADLGKLLDCVDAAEQLYKALKARTIAPAEHRALGEALDRLKS